MSKRVDISVQMTKGQLVLALNAVALMADVKKRTLIADGFDKEQAAASVDVLRCEVLEQTLLQQLQAITGDSVILSGSYMHADDTKKTI